MSHEDEEKKRRPPRASVVRPEFPGQEDIECWQVMHIDGVGQDEGLDDFDFMAAIINPAATVWMDGKNLTYADAAALTAKLMEQYPERRYFVMPTVLRKPS
jgi:hypothetical protein